MTAAAAAAAATLAKNINAPNSGIVLISFVLLQIKSKKICCGFFFMIIFFTFEGYTADNGLHQPKEPPVLRQQQNTDHQNQQQQLEQQHPKYMHSPSQTLKVCR